MQNSSVAKLQLYSLVNNQCVVGKRFDNVRAARTAAAAVTRWVGATPQDAAQHWGSPEPRRVEPSWAPDRIESWRADHSRFWIRTQESPGVKKWDQMVE